MKATRQASIENESKLPGSDSSHLTALKTAQHHPAPQNLAYGTSLSVGGICSPGLPCIFVKICAHLGQDTGPSKALGTQPKIQILKTHSLSSFTEQPCYHVASDVL